MNLPTYPLCSSEIRAPWLGELPEHWEVKRLKFIFPRLFSGVSVNSDNSPSLDGSVAILKTSCVYGNRFNAEENKRVVETELDRVACPVTRDSLVISRMNTPELVGSCGYVDRDYEHLFLPDRLWIARFPNHIHAAGKFAWYLVISHALASLTGVLATGTSDSMKNLTQEAFLDICVGVPPRSEQQQIAAFLDWKTGQIDVLIALKKELLEKLKENLLAVITQAVTRGLNPDATLRDSGIPWLGRVPAHWEVKKLSRVTKSRCDGPFGSGLKSEHYTDEGIRVIRLQNIGFADFNDEDKAFIDPDYYAELGDHDVHPGDLLVAGLGDTSNPVGRACRAPDHLGPAMVKADCFRYRFERGKADSQFMAYQMSITAMALAGALASGVTRARMNLSHTSDRVFAFPPIEEQVEIATFLNSRSDEVRRMLETVNAAIARLTEYRTALITAATTGKIDVRAVKIPNQAT